MSSHWREAVNQPVGPASIRDLNSYIVKNPASYVSPIDAFYTSTQKLLKIGNPDFFLKYKDIGVLLMIGIISATENYFRDIFSQVLRICPIARSRSADQNIMLGSVVWHGGVDVERGAFEHIAFSDSNNIRKACKNFLGHEIKNSSPVNTQLLEYDKICELRHGIAHSNSILAGKNAIRLQISHATCPLHISIDFQLLQEACSVCTNLVVSFNIELFEVIAKRWAVEWPRQAAWKEADSNKCFKAIWKCFYSEIDDGNKTIKNKLSMIRCRNSVKKNPG